ncbi:regulator [Streptomyces sp. SID8379]|uniref:ATP-binding protein n=1 Tax=unclassified Streptomyces TaxID=2593676 RepID=UPI001319C958|nr:MULTISPECIES: regulator [unclassified Streptomyces]MYW65602.1 regulator [Streptomyces sp. SID8379]
MTLNGVGGVGKSRLAVRAARRAAPRFPDGVRLVGLSPLREPSLLGYVVLEELGLADQSTRPPEDVVAEWLATRDVLLVLDSCEHMIDACARLAVLLLDAAPGLRILATSREPLGVAGEWCVEVEPLPVAADPARDPGGGDAVALFLDRARAGTDGLRPDRAEQVSAADVCRRLDGIPLAIELAAARLPELSVHQLGEGLRHRFDTLITADGVRTPLPPRHRTLRTTIGWSHELCTPLERLLWARLCVCAAGFDGADARAVAAGGPLSADAVPALLDGLVAKSVVRPVPGTAEPVRYRMLDTVREFGAHWLGELGEEAAVRQAHLEHYRSLVTRADREWLTDRQTAWATRVVAEHANVRAALDHALREGRLHTVLEMTGALWFFWFACGFTHEGRFYLERALADAPGPGPEYAKALWAYGLVTMSQGSPEEALRHADEFRVLAERSADPTARVAACCFEGTPLFLTGDCERAITVLDGTTKETLSGSYEVACFLNRIVRAFARITLGEFASGKALAHEVSVELAARGERWARAYGDYVQAVAAFGLGDWADAAEHARASMRGKRHFHDTSGVALAVDVLAAATVADGRNESGAALLGTAQRLWQSIGRPQLGAPPLVAVREQAERQSRRALGGAAYTRAYESGLYGDTVDGIAYSTRA